MRDERAFRDERPRDGPRGDDRPPRDGPRDERLPRDRISDGHDDRRVRGYY